MRRLFFALVTGLVGALVLHIVIIFALPLFADCLGARHRHMADGAFVLDDRRSRRVVDRFTPHARLPVRIA